MSRYSSQELRDMARTVVDNEKRGGGRALYLYFAIAETMGLHPNEVRQKVYDLARRPMNG